MENYENTIQIVAFSTNTDSAQIQSPYEIMKIYLKNHDHILLKKKSGLAIAFTQKLPNSSLTTKIMICSALDLSREYNGIKDVNCYLIFVDLESEDSKTQLNLITHYFLKNCNLLKKIYIIGIYSSYAENFKKRIDEEDIKQMMYKEKINKYIYKEMDVENNNNVSEIIVEIFSAVVNVPNTKKKVSEKQDNNCFIF